MHASTVSPPRRGHKLATMALFSALAGCASGPPLAQPAPAASVVPVAIVATVVASATASIAAPAPTSLAQGFARWVNAFRVTARAAGITDETLQQALHDVHYLPRVVELDRSQPEFTRTVWTYLDNAVSAQRVQRGQDKLLEVRAQADAAAARYGVPADILVAIWGMESNYGSNYGDISTIDALATLGFEGRREDWARSELIAALKIIQNGDIDRAHMIGSWAGAMGQTQFLPSNFLAYAVDADGDGRRDIWGSMADVLASTANFLARSGWQAAQPWGTEVRLPQGFDYARANPAVRQAAAQWAAEGVQTMDGVALPPVDDAQVLLPAGAHGPAFLVGPSFRAILRYNNSTSYALAVSLLAQQLADGPGVLAAWPRQLQALTRAQVTALQTALNQRGFASGTADGVMGPATSGAVRQYQQSIGLPADGYADRALLLRLSP